MIMPGSRFQLEVQPHIPRTLARLEELANDLVYSWDRRVRALFARLDRPLWVACGGSPRLFLRRVSQALLDEAAQDRSFLEEYRRVLASHDAYMERRIRPECLPYLDPARGDLVAYFCAEFGLHESFPIYSGGLGILAGDHCKAASDLGIPFVAVGLLYHNGYFTQRIDGHGHQVSQVVPMDFRDLPITPVHTTEGEQMRIVLDFPGRRVAAHVWEARVGQIRLYLLDTDLEENSEADRRITRQLYGGGRETRIEQEIVLGIGGVRALRRLGLRPSAWHINEGHSAFLVLERAREYVEQGMDFATAHEIVAASTVFTTHTPVAAGHDIFESALVETYFAGYVGALGLDLRALLALGSVPEPNGSFNMTTLALKGSRFHNGVSRIHGRVAAAMERAIWPEVPPDENPMTHVTNGVHVPTFLAGEWFNLFETRFDDWHAELNNPAYWECIEQIPDYQFWSIHKQLKEWLLVEITRRVRAQCTRNGESASTIARITRLIDNHESDTLVMGFARRFATYKRASLLFSDPQRLARLLNDPQRPTVIVFAGKAHPSDGPGQHLIKVIHEFARQPEFEGKIILLEAYDVRLARQLVSGVDLWLNTPEYPLEASGTSGQKAAINGVINLSVLDGWWGEGYDGENGWGIMPRDPRMDAEQRNRDEAKDLLDLIEHEVLPLYFARDARGLSPGWVRKAKASMKSCIPRFNARRMVMDYIRQLYSPAREQHARLCADGGRPARELAEWKARVRARWPGVTVVLSTAPPTAVYHDQRVPLAVRVNLNGLDPADLTVECLVDPPEGIEGSEQRVLLEPRGGDNNAFRFATDLAPVNSGLQELRLRLYPHHPLLSHRFELGLMLWI
jgi:starch phosphorylase